jgi:hypothetical protein
MDGWMHACMDGWMDVWIDGQINGLIKIHSNSCSSSEYNKHLCQKAAFNIGHINTSEPLP